MPFLDKIISKVDEMILASSLTDARFQNRFFAGLVQQIPVKNFDGSKTIFIPAILHGVNDAQQVVPDDSFNIITYHRIISNTYEKIVAGSVGDGMNAQRATSDMIMIVIGFNDKLLLTVEQLEALFVGGFPDQLPKTFSTDLQMSLISASISSTNFDSVALFSQEYRGEENFIRPNMSLFQIRYRITAAFKKGCFTICEDC